MTGLKTDHVNGNRPLGFASSISLGALRTANGLVFISTFGTPLHARSVLRIWLSFLTEAGLERRAFHASRHRSVSLLIAEGVPIKVIQEVVGHSLLGTTAGFYGHLLPLAYAEAANAMDRALD